MSNSTESAFPPPGVDAIFKSKFGYITVQHECDIYRVVKFIELFFPKEQSQEKLSSSTPEKLPASIPPCTPAGTPEKSIHPTSREPPNLEKAVDELKVLINENQGELPYGTILSIAKKYDLKPNGINYRLKTLGITYKVMTHGGNIRKPYKLPRSFSAAFEEALIQAGPQKKIAPEAVTNLLAKFGINSYRPEFMQRLSICEISCVPALASLPEPAAAPALPQAKDLEPAVNKRTCSRCDFYEPINNLKGLCNSSDDPLDVSADGYCKFFDFKGA